MLIDSCMTVADVEELDFKEKSQLFVDFGTDCRLKIDVPFLYFQKIMCAEEAFLLLQAKSLAFKSFPYPLLRRLCGWGFSFLGFLFLITYLFWFKFIFNFLLVFSCLVFSGGGHADCC